MTRPYFDPGKQGKCPECRATFSEPDVRELDGDNLNLAYHCPKCGYQYACWPKDLSAPWRDEPVEG